MKSRQTPSAQYEITMRVEGRVPHPPLVMALPAVYGAKVLLDQVGWRAI